VIGEVAGCWRVPGYRSSRRHVIRGGEVAQHQQTAGVLDALQFGNLTGHAVEEGNLLYVGGLGIPGK